MTDLSRDPTRLAAWSRRLATSDGGAMEELFAAMHDRLRRYAESLVWDDATAADVVQEAFIRIWMHRAELDPERSIRALLYRTVRNLAFNHLRDVRTRADLLAEQDAPGGWRDPGPEARAAGNELGDRLRGWIAALPDRQREALMLSRFEGLSHAEIADVMGVAPRTVNNHLVRALQTLKDRLDVYERPVELR